MATKRAKTLTDREIERLLKLVENSPIVESDRLKILLSFYAGLRVSEIAKLKSEAMLTADGRVAPYINIFSNVGKNRKERSIPMHPRIKEAFKAFLKRHPDEEFVALPYRQQHLTTNGLTVWFHSLYKRAGFTGCSSHSGRRTFITTLARSANQFGSSLKDVQAIAGHSRLDTTEAYIEPSDNIVGLVHSLGQASSRKGVRSVIRDTGPQRRFG